MSLLSSVTDLLTRVVVAGFDPRSGDGWGPLQAVRAPILVIGAIVLNAAVYWFHAPVPDSFVLGWDMAALAVLSHDTGLQSRAQK